MTTINERVEEYRDEYDGICLCPTQEVCACIKLTPNELKQALQKQKEATAREIVEYVKKKLAHHKQVFDYRDALVDELTSKYLT